MPTGGITAERENLEKWIKAGACCVGMGSKLISKQDVANKDFVNIEKRVAEAIAIVKELKK